MLTGSFGRGKVEYINIKGYRLVNDLDLAVFVEKNYYRVKRKYNSLIEKLAFDLQSHSKGIKQVDIHITNSWLYRFVPNLVRYYEIKNGYKTIYGSWTSRK